MAGLRVKELIELLQTHPPEMWVCVDHEAGPIVVSAVCRRSSYDKHPYFQDPTHDIVMLVMQ